MNKAVFRSVRYSLYFAFVLNGVIQWLVPFPYKCNFTSEKCFACGLRTAVDLFLQGRFSEAYQSNKLIYLIILFISLMMLDVFIYLKKQKKSDFRKGN